MIRKVFGKIFSSRVFYIIFSLIVAVSLWMFVEIAENRDVEHEVSGVPIRFKNAELLSDRGLLIRSTSPQTVTLTYYLPRVTTRFMTRETLAVEVNLVDVERTGLAYLPYNIIYPPGITRDSFSLETKDVERITLYIDRLTTLPIPVRVEYTGGTASDDLIEDPVFFEPQTIMVSGPGDVVSRIDHARVVIPRENISTTYIYDLGFILIGDNGEEIDGQLLEYVTASQETIRVTVPIRQLKVIPLTVDLVHSAGTSDRNTHWEINPQYITVSGDPDVLKDLDHIMLTPIDMSRFSLIDTQARSINVPPNVTNESGETEALVMVEVFGLDYVDYSISNLFVINQPDGLEVEWITQSVDVRIRGRREDLNRISEMNIRVVADIKDRAIGSHRVPAVVHITGVDADVGALNLTDLRVSLRLVLPVVEEP